MFLLYEARVQSVVVFYVNILVILKVTHLCADARVTHEA